MQYYFWIKYIGCLYICFQMYFLIDHHCETQSELTEMLKKQSEFTERLVEWKCATHEKVSRFLLGFQSFNLSIRLLSSNWRKILLDTATWLVVNCDAMYILLSSTKFRGVSSANVIMNSFTSKIVNDFENMHLTFDAS